MGVSAQEREVGRPLTWWIRHLVFFAAAVALFVWALREWSALLLLDTSRPEACGEEPEHLSRSGAMWFALVGYLAGGGIALLRTEREYLEPQCQVLDRAYGWRSSRTRGYIVLWSFLTLVVVLLGYETYAVANHVTAQTWPITYFARCANEVTSAAPRFSPQWWSLPVGLGLLSFILGHWFWYPLQWRSARDEHIEPQVWRAIRIIVGVVLVIVAIVVLAKILGLGFRLALTLVVLGWLGLSTFYEIVAWTLRESAAARLHAWSGQYPVFAALVAFLLGFLYGHLF